MTLERRSSDRSMTEATLPNPTPLLSSALVAMLLLVAIYALCVGPPPDLSQLASNVLP